MRKLVYLVAASADGKIARLDGSFDCFPMGGDHVDDYLKTLESFGDVLMGRSTYEVGLKAGITNPYPSMRVHAPLCEGMCSRQRCARAPTRTSNSCLAIPPPM